MKLKFYLFILIAVFALSACGDVSTNSSGGSNSGGILKPNISGSSGEVLIVMDNYFWKNEAGEILRQTLEQEYPALPQPEPLLDVTHITQGAFDNLFKHHRTIVLSKIESNIPEAGVSYQENVWAKPQLVVQLYAPDSYSLTEFLNKEKNAILRNILSYDRKRLKDIFADSKDPAIRSVVSNFNIRLAIPRGYNLDIQKEDFASISIETSKTSQVIFIYEYPYSGPEDFSKTNIINKRNEFLKRNTKGSRPGSYLTTAELYPPIVNDIKKNGRDIVEVRGLWELHHGFMGGPFISHTTVDKNRNMIVTVEGYVYNPNEKKRNLMRHMEAIVYSMEIIEE